MKPAFLSSPTKPQRRKRSAWQTWLLKQLHTWHWITSAIALIGLLLFAFTGITLNHAADIEGQPTVTESSTQLPPALLPAIRGDDETKGPVPPAVAQWLDGTLGVTAPAEAEWSPDEIYLALPRPGGDGWLTIDRTTGAIAREDTDRGWISYLNDLHKGRNAGRAWFWFIDIFSVACFLFALTGLALLWLHSAKRPSTWPLVAAGLVVPALLAILFIH